MAVQAQAGDEARKTNRRMKRIRRVSWAKGTLHGVISMLRPGDLAIDCGANVGAVTSQLADSGADVVSFEPDPHAYGLLEEACSGRPNVTLINAAVGLEDGRAALFRSDDFDENPKRNTIKSTLIPGGRSVPADMAPAATVDQIDFPKFVRQCITERGEIAFLKFDIEGAELDLMEHMRADGLFDNIRFTVAETHERKYRDRAGDFAALRRRIEAQYPPTKVNLDWI
ncbi:MAG: FkbM family methyltransferase [Pseudomonadota bacterium]